MNKLGKFLTVFFGAMAFVAVFNIAFFKLQATEFIISVLIASLFIAFLWYD